MSIHIAEELKQLISFKPVSTEKDNSRDLLRHLALRVQDLELEHKIVTKNGFSSLIAGTQSLSECDILLQAHIDVVPGSDDLFDARIDGDILTGRGAYDMLFAPVCFLKVLEKLSKTSQLSKHNIGVIFTSDEELGGFDGLPNILKNYRAKVCLLPDAGGKDSLSIGSKGVLEVKLTIHGQGGHAARPIECENPIEITADVIKALQNLFPNADPNETTCSLTKIEAGDALNRIPNTASLFLNIRFKPGDNPTDIKKRIKDSVSDFGASLEELVCEPAFSNDINHPLTSLFVKSYEEVTKRQVQTMLAPGSSDARFFPVSTPVIMMRPDGKGLHADHEQVSLSSMEEFIRVILHYVHHFDTIRSSHE